LNPFKTRGPVPPSAVTPQRQYASKYRWSLIGTVASGKSTIAALLVFAARTLSQQLPRFFCDVDEASSNILIDVSNLQRGRFPPKTKAYSTYATEAGLLMWWDQMFSNRSMNIPLCDLAGEDLQAGMKGSMTAPSSAAYSQATQLKEYVRDSDGFILVAPASKALLFKNDAQVEKEQADIAFDPDVNLARIFGDIINYRRKQNKPIKGCAICISKWDMIAPYAGEMGMDILTESGLTEFMNICFPSTSMKIKALQNPNVRFFPMFIETEKNGDGSTKVWEDGTGSPRILVKDRRIPSFSALSCVNLINFLGSFAT
jgi:hypothetical protein